MTELLRRSVSAADVYCSAITTRLATPTAVLQGGVCWKSADVLITSVKMPGIRTLVVQHSLADLSPNVLLQGSHEELRWVPWGQITVVRQGTGGALSEDGLQQVQLPPQQLSMFDLSLESFGQP